VSRWASSAISNFLPIVTPSNRMNRGTERVAPLPDALPLAWQRPSPLTPFRL